MLKGIGKGKEEGKHTYPASKPSTVDNSQELNAISQNIATNCNDSAELKDNKLIVYEEDIIEIRPQHPKRFGKYKVAADIYCVGLEDFSVANYVGGNEGIVFAYFIQDTAGSSK